MSDTTWLLAVTFLLAALAMGALFIISCLTE